MKRRRMSLALAMAAWAAMSGSVLLAQGVEPSYSLEGALFAWATIAAVGHEPGYIGRNICTSRVSRRGRSWKWSTPKLCQ